MSNVPSEPSDVKSFHCDEESIILLTPKFIVMGAKKDELSEITTAIQSNPTGFKSSDTLTVIDLNSIDSMEYRNDLDGIDINFQADGETDSVFLGLDTQEVVEDFIKAFHAFTNHAFEAVTKQCTSKEAATYPMLLTAFIIIVGTALTFVVNMYHDYVPQRTMIVKAFVYYFYQFCRIVGPLPVALLTVILAGLCIVWLIKSLKNPPIKTVLNKR